jgi:hypothetical protein
MGAVAGVLRSKIGFSGELEGHTKGDDRRRNSLAYNIMQFVNFEGDDFTRIIEEVEICAWPTIAICA